MARFTRAEKDAFAERMRLNPTGSEALLHDRLRHYGFLSQQNVLGWIVDLYHPEHRLVVEVDGSSHARKVDSDIERNLAMLAAGYRIARVDATLVIRNVDSAAEWLLARVTDPTEHWFADPRDGVIAKTAEHGLAALDREMRSEGQAFVRYYDLAEWWLSRRPLFPGYDGEPTFEKVLNHLGEWFGDPA